MKTTAIVSKQQSFSIFYKLTKSELLWMHQNKLIKNAAYVYLALKLENPFCDRPVEINVKEFKLSWGIAVSSFYAALTELKQLKVIKLLNHRVRIQWQEGFEPPAPLSDEPNHSQQASLSDNLDSQQGEFSRNLEFIPESKNEFQESRKDSRILEFENLNPLPVKESSSFQTIQTISETTDSRKQEVVTNNICKEIEQPVPKNDMDTQVKTIYIDEELEDLPRQEELRQMGVNVKDPEVRKALAQYQGRIINPIRAFLEYAQGTQVKNPTSTFVTAVRKNWEPNGNYDQPSIPKEKNPISEEQLAKLEDFKSNKEIADYYFSGDGIVKVIPFREVKIKGQTVKVPDPTKFLTWWEFLK